MTVKDLILKLHDINAIKFGQFKLVSGVISPIYLDLKMTISHPQVLRAVADAMWEKISNTPFDLICGVPYTALPIATVLSIDHNKPMIIRRKEQKNYGIIKPLEGSYQAGQQVVVVEDLVTSGTSVLETITPLEAEGLVVKNIIILVDREQGGKQNLEEKGYRLHAVMTITEMLHVLQQTNRLTTETVAAVTAFLKQNQVKPIER